MAAEAVCITEDELRKYVQKIYTASGMREEEAYIAADNLVFANLCGMESHGVLRVPTYVKRLEDGGTLAAADTCLVRESPTTALMDGGNAMGSVVGTKAMDLCIEKAEKAGVAFVGCRNSNHYGMCSYFSVKALPHDMIGFTCTSPASLLMAPTGGLDPILDNNPFSFAVPAEKELPVVLDMATTVVARGKLSVAKDRGEQVPDTWALTRDGKRTTDPVEAFNGILLPTGGYKGYGLTVISGILSAVLTGASILKDEIKDFYADTRERENIGHLFGCMRIDCFMDPADFKKKMDCMIEEIKSSRKMPGVEEILLPGEKELKNKMKREKDGIPLTGNTYTNLLATGDRLGVPQPHVEKLL